MASDSTPILYSFRRCPYAMRARMAIAISGVVCEIREVVLRDKPPAMLDVSPKGTVPVVVLGDGAILEESLDVMHWALSQNDPEGWLDIGDTETRDHLIHHMDQDFKGHLDRYKYPTRYENVDPLYHRAEAEKFLQALDGRLQGQPYLFGKNRSLVDIALFPFIRQFANTNRGWFDDLPMSNLQSWLADHLNSPLFLGVMRKYNQWHDGDDPKYFPDGSTNQS